MSKTFDGAKVHYLFRNSRHRMLKNIKFSGNVCMNQYFIREIVQSSILFCNFTAQKHQ